MTSFNVGGKVRLTGESWPDGTEGWYNGKAPLRGTEHIITGLDEEDAAFTDTNGQTWYVDGEQSDAWAAELVERAPVPDKHGEDAEVVHDDPVNHPSHYTAYNGIEVIQLTEQLNFCRGNAVKYIARAGLKDPDKEIEDLEKAAFYIQREINRLKQM